MSSVTSLLQEVGRAFRGRPDVVEKAVLCFLARGHLLIEDEPGVGKTLLAQSLAKALGLAFRRVQMTPDLLPADVSGGLVWIPQPGEFRFRPGPLFSSVVLLDELNRASSKTQSAVLQAMEERHVTVDGVDRELSPLFFVIATQNPEESIGVNPLPESQLDRFSLKIQLGRPAPDVEKSLLASGDREERLDPVRAPLTEGQLAAEQEKVKKITVSDAVLDYLIRLAAAFREGRRLGLSTRALQSLTRLAQARAHIGGRDFVMPDDVQFLVREAWSHRLRGAPAVEIRRHVEEVLDQTRVR